MAKAATPAVVHLSEILEALDAAIKVLQQRNDPKLIDKITVLQGYLELSQMFPDRDYNPILRRAMSEVRTDVQFHLES